MGTRAVILDGFSLFIWMFLAFLQLSFSMRHYEVPLFSVVIAVVFGIVVGALLEGVIVQRQLKRLTSKSEYRVALYVWLYLIGAVFIVLGSFYLASLYVPFSEVAVLYYFLIPLLLVGLSTRIVLFLNWERKHRRVILIDGLWSSKLYVFPKMDDA